MGYKKIGEEISFADLAMSKCIENNRSVQLMDRINKVIKWRNIEALLMEYYETGKTKEGADAYPPILLLQHLFKKYMIQLRIKIHSLMPTGDGLL